MNKLFRGISVRFSTENEGQYETIGAFWDYLGDRFGKEKLRGLGYNWTAGVIEYAIGFREEEKSGEEWIASLEQIKERYPQALYKEILLPTENWITYQGKLEDLSATYDEIYKEGVLSYEIETFTEDGRFQVEITREYPELIEVKEEELSQILKLYHNAIGSEGCVWDEDYPNEKILREDIGKHCLYGIKDPSGAYVALIARDRDEEVDSLDCWDKEAKPATEFARLVVDERYQNQGMARVLLRQGMKLLQQKGFRALHFLVAKENERANRSYAALGFTYKGDTKMFGHEYDCYEMIF